MAERTRELREKSEAIQKKNEELEKTHRMVRAINSEIIQEWKSSGVIKPRRFEETSILFTGFKGFTNTVAMMPAWKLVAELNEIFGHFDEIIEKKGLEKLKTIGDSYMIAGGLPRETSDQLFAV